MPLIARVVGLHWVWFDRLLEQDAETFHPLIAHPSVRPYLEALMGPQCQLCSFRAHIIVPLAG